MATPVMSGGNNAISHADIIAQEVQAHGLEFHEGNQLRWPENDPGHPRHWSSGTKFFNAALVISLDAITTIISTSGAAAGMQGRIEFEVGAMFIILSFTSMYCLSIRFGPPNLTSYRYLFGQAIGALICPPISESFGRKQLYVWSMFIYSSFCVLLGASMNIYWVFAGRFFSGMVSSIPTLIVAGSIEDMFDTEARVWMIFAWGVSANIALTIGPIYSTFIVSALNWRWVFWVASIVTFCLAIATLSLRESRPSQILETRLSRLNKITTSDVPFTMDNPDEVFSVKKFIANSMTRPARLFVTEPIVFLVTVLSAMGSGQIYLLTEAIPIIYKEAPLSFSDKQASLAFIPIAIGLVLDIIPRFYDQWLLKQIRVRGGIIQPEHKIRAFGVAAPLLAIGLWWFAWTIPPGVPAPWFVTFLPLVFVGFATNEFDCILAGYMADLYTIYCASAIGSLGFLRSIVSGVLPLVTHQMYHNLGNNKATSVLAGIATLFCVVPVLLLKYGQQLRQRSKFASFSHDAEMKMCSGSRVDLAHEEIGVDLNMENAKEEVKVDVSRTENVEMWLWRNFYLK